MNLRTAPSSGSLDKPVAQSLYPIKMADLGVYHRAAAP